MIEIQNKAEQEMEEMKNEFERLNLRLRNSISEGKVKEKEFEEMINLKNRRIEELLSEIEWLKANQGNEDKSSIEAKSLGNLGNISIEHNKTIDNPDLDVNKNHVRSNLLSNHASQKHNQSLNQDLRLTRKKTK